MNWKRTYSITAMLVGILAICSLVLRRPSENGASQSKKIIVAANIPLSGNLAVYGVSIKRGVELAQKEMVTKNANIQFNWSDNRSDIKEAVTIMRRDLALSPTIYLSGASPHQVKAIWGEISNQKIPHFVWIFEKQINKSSEGNNLRTWVNFKEEPYAYLKYVDFRNPQRVAILYTQNPAYKDEFENTVIPSLKGKGINAILSQEYPYDGTDFRTLAEKTKLFKPDLIILAGYQSHLMGLVRAFRPLGLINDGNTIATYDMLDTATVLGVEELEGIRMVTPTFVARPDTSERVAWIAEFEREYRVSPLYTDAYAYDMTCIIHDAAKRLPSNAGRKDWIKALRETNLTGITGPLKFDDDGSLMTSIDVGVFREGKIVLDDSITLSETKK